MRWLTGRCLAHLWPACTCISLADMRRRPEPSADCVRRTARALLDRRFFSFSAASALLEQCQSRPCPSHAVRACKAIQRRDPAHRRAARSHCARTSPCPCPSGQQQQPQRSTVTAAEQRMSAVPKSGASETPRSRPSSRADDPETHLKLERAKSGPGRLSPQAGGTPQPRERSSASCAVGHRCV